MITRVKVGICLLVAAPLWAATAVHSPYLQNVRGNRALVVWSTRENMVGKVQFSTDQSFDRSATSRIRGFTPEQTGLPWTFYQHQAELTDLAPGAEYFYRVIMADGTNLSPESEHHFRTPGPGKATFLVFGDSGSGSANQQALTAAIVKERPDFILHVGDMAYEDGNYNQFQSNYFDSYKPIMRRAPVFPSPGNHEYYTDRAAPYLNLHAVPSDKVPEIDRGRYYSFDWGAVHFLSLDSNLLDNGFSTARMLAWLEEDLASAAAPWKVAYFHHLPYPLEHHLDDPYCANVRHTLLPVLEKYGVQLVFAGHEHIYERTKALRSDTPIAAGRGTVYVTTGGAGGTGHDVQPRDFVARSYAVYHYLRVDADDTHITVNAVDGSSKVFDTSVLTIPAVTSREAVVNGASFQPGLAPGGIVSIFGKGLAADTAAAADVPLPAALAGTNVTANGESLPLYYVSQGQINAQLRMDQLGPVTLRVTTASGSSEVQVDVAESAPGIFPGAIQHADGTAVTSASPARPGEMLVVYACGLGAVDRQLDAGEVTPIALARTLARVTAEIGGVAVDPYFAGLTPNYVGLYQVNMQVPATLDNGDYTIRLRSRGAVSNAVTIPVVR